MLLFNPNNIHCTKRQRTYSDNQLFGKTQKGPVGMRKARQLYLSPAQDFLDNLALDDIARVMQKLCSESEAPDKKGGVLAVAIRNRHTGDTSFESITVGDAGKRCVEFAKNAAEKIHRLMGRRDDGYKDIAASKSANPNHRNKRLRTYGGCLVFIDGGDEYYISFSGATAHVDEVLVFVIGENEAV